MLLVTFAGQRKDAPHLGLAACFGEDLGFLARHGRSGIVHLFRVVHDAVGRIFGKDHQIESRQSKLHADDHVGNLLRVFENLGFRMQAWHFVINHCYADGVFATRDIAVQHEHSPW